MKCIVISLVKHHLYQIAYVIQFILKKYNTSTHFKRIFKQKITWVDIWLSNAMKIIHFEVSRCSNSHGKPGNNREFDKIMNIYCIQKFLYGFLL